MKSEGKNAPISFRLNVFDASLDTPLWQKMLKGKMKRLVALQKSPAVVECVTKFGASFVSVQMETEAPALALFSQYALETGWNQNVLIVHDEQDEHVLSNNLFNIKTTPQWKGKSGWQLVREVINGRDVFLKQSFRVYESYGESIADYVRFITTQPRYAVAWENRKDPFRYAEEIFKAGYATDPEYLRMWKSIMTKSVALVDL